MHEAARIIVEEYDGSPSWLYTSNFQRSFQTALVMREDLGLLFSEVRTEFSGLLDPRKDGKFRFPGPIKLERSLGKRFERSSIDASTGIGLFAAICERRVGERFVQKNTGGIHEIRGIVFRHGYRIGFVYADTLSCFCAALYGTDLGDTI